MYIIIGGIYHKFNGDFKSHINFGRTMGWYVALLKFSSDQSTSPIVILKVMYIIIGGIQEEHKRDVSKTSNITPAYDSGFDTSFKECEPLKHLHLAHQMFS
jgi:hypothetical protein